MTRSKPSSAGGAGPMSIGSPLPMPDGLLDMDGAPFAWPTDGALVVFFFPKADTPGCTTEAQDFSTLQADFARTGAAVVGVSRDTPTKLAKFAAKYGLTILLASDSEGRVTEAFGVWVEKMNYGRTYMGIERATFLFGVDGALKTVWRNVRVKGHAQTVLDALG